MAARADDPKRLQKERLSPTRNRRQPAGVRRRESEFILIPALKYTVWYREGKGVPGDVRCDQLSLQHEIVMSNASPQPQVPLKAGPAAARSFGRAANWTVGIATILVLLISGGGYSTIANGYGASPRNICGCS